MDLNRRQLLVASATVAVCTCVAGGEPSDAAGEGGGGPLDVGALSDYASPGVYDRFAKSDKVILIRTADVLVAFSATCTHKRCTLRARDAKVYCNCHKSTFDETGAPDPGSPAAKPLPRYAIVKSPEGRVTVDKSHVVTDASDPAASIQL